MYVTSSPRPDLLRRVHRPNPSVRAGQLSPRPLRPLTHRGSRPPLTCGQWRALAHPDGPAAMICARPRARPRREPQTARPRARAAASDRPNVSRDGGWNGLPPSAENRVPSAAHGSPEPTPTWSPPVCIQHPLIPPSRPRREPRTRGPLCRAASALSVPPPLSVGRPVAAARPARRRPSACVTS